MGPMAILERYDADPSGWHPGKSDQVKFGPSPVLNKAKRRCIATSAMALGQEGMEPTYKNVAAQQWQQRPAAGPATGGAAEQPAPARETWLPQLATPAPAPLREGALHALTLSRAPLSRAPAMARRHQMAPWADKRQTA